MFFSDMRMDTLFTVIRTDKLFKVERGDKWFPVILERMNALQQ